MKNPLIEQDLGPALWMLENQINTVNDLVRFWGIFKTRQTDCPRIERLYTDWRAGLWD